MRARIGRFLMPRKKSEKLLEPTKAPARRARPALSPTEKKVSTWNFRVEPRTEALIDAAAATVGSSRTEFVLQSARAHAEHVLLNRLYFTLNDTDWASLKAALDAPAPPNHALKAAFRATPVWDRT